MSNDFVLPTTVEAFVQFLNGKPKKNYGDQGSIVVDVLKHTIQLAIHDEIGQSVKGPSIDEYRFLRNVFVTFSYRIRRAFTPALGPPDDARVQAIREACITWTDSFVHFDIQQSKDTISMVRTSQVPNLVQTLLQDIEKGDIPASENDDRILRISGQLLLCMRQYLDLKLARSTEPLLTSAVRGMNIQEALDGDLLDSKDWQQAWNQPFRGQALDALEMKLQLNADAIRTDHKKADMSRIIPVVQASGTGKSRLSEEFVRKNFGVMLSLRNGSGFPDCDNYVSEYFKNALDLGSNLAQETPLSASQLKPLEPQHIKYLNHRLNDDAIPKEEESVYHGHWRFLSPTKDAVPRPWAAGARLRVACFFIGLFNTMVEYMSRGICDSAEKWRTNYLHSGEPSAEENRRRFWHDVITAALYELRPNSDNRQMMESWLNQNEPNITNKEINRHLESILMEPIQKFFNHPVTNQCLDESKRPFHGPSGRASPTQQVVPFLLIVDEAAHLYQSNYMHSFMWVLDQPIMRILSKMQTDTANINASNFFVLTLGTHSQISYFAPHYVYPSERYFTGEQYIASVFLSMDWDIGLRSLNGQSDFRASSHIRHLVRWGRPLWTAVYDGRRPPQVKELVTEQMDKSDLRRCVLYAEKKLLPAKQDMANKDQLDLSAFAILAIRLHLDLDFAYPSRASKLVSSKMRWLVDVDPRRKRIVTTYGSEPLLVEGAALAMNSRDLYSDPVVKLLEDLKEQLNQGFVNRGENGEMTARLLLLLAKDQATREAWWKDSDFIRVISDRHRRENIAEEFRRPGSTYFFKEASLFYEYPSSPHAFYHREVKVKDFFRALLKSDVSKRLEEHFVATKKWASLDGAYVNFTHWAFVDGDHASVPYQKKGFYVSWLRHNAYICQSGFPSIDLVIPMAFPNTDGAVTPECMSFIVISVKNCNHTEGIKMEGILSKEAVEGVMAVKDHKKRKLDNKADAFYTHGNHPLNVRLTLNALKFINPSGVASVADDDERWIEFSEHKPYIAFAMSMAQINRSEHLFAAEEARANSHRIAFAFGGLTNTYEFRRLEIQEIIQEFLIRHDRSGKYPQSKLEYQGEKRVVDLARAPHDDKYRCVDVLCPSSELMDLD